MSHEKKDSALQKMQLILLSAAIMIVLAQLNINLIINGFKISLAVICLPLFAFLFEHFPVFPVTLITAPGILLVRCIVEWLHSGEIAEAFWFVFAGDVFPFDVRRTVCHLCAIFPNPAFSSGTVPADSGN